MTLFMFLVILNITFAPAICSAAVSVDKQLEKRGFPKNIISMLTDEDKNEILSHADSKFAGSETTIKSMEGINISDDVSPMGTIPSSDLSLTCGGAYWTTAGEKYLYIIIDYDWLWTPLWRLTDEIGITWDPTKWEVVDDDYDFTASHRAQSSGLDWDDTSYDARDLGADSIIGDVDLIIDSMHEYGHATILLKLKSGVTAPTTTQVFYKYGHAMVIPTVSMTINPSGFGIGLSSSINVDSLAKSFTYSFSWK